MDFLKLVMRYFQLKVLAKFHRARAYLIRLARNWWFTKRWARRHFR